MWGCREHWFKLPKQLRDAVWRAYRPGQEITKTPSVRYLVVAALVQLWIAGKVTINSDGSIVVHEEKPCVCGPGECCGPPGVRCLLSEFVVTAPVDIDG